MLSLIVLIEIVIEMVKLLGESANGCLFSTWPYDTLATRPPGIRTKTVGTGSSHPLATLSAGAAVAENGPMDQTVSFTSKDTLSSQFESR